MATIKTAIALYDGVTSPLKSIHHALELVLNTFESMQDASKKAVDVAAIKAAREELAKAGTAFDAIEKSIRDADTAQQKLNADLERGTLSAASMGDRIRNFVSLYAVSRGVSGLFNLAKNALTEFDNGSRSDTQLRAVLANSGGGQGATLHSNVSGFSCAALSFVPIKHPPSRKSYFRRAEGERGECGAQTPPDRNVISKSAVN